MDNDIRIDEHTLSIIINKTTPFIIIVETIWTQLVWTNQSMFTKSSLSILVLKGKMKKN